MNKALDNLLERRSIRSYKPGQISDDELNSVLKAGLAAPSAMNRQPTVLLVVQDKATIQLLSKLNALVMGKEGIDPFTARRRSSSCCPTAISPRTSRTAVSFSEIS